MKRHDHTQRLAIRASQRRSKKRVDAHVGQELILGKQPLDIAREETCPLVQNVGARCVRKIILEVLGDCAVDAQRDGAHAARIVRQNTTDEGIANSKALG